MQDDWDLETAEVKPPVPKRKRRSIVSVPFSYEDFGKVCKAAEVAGKPLSRYIREQTLVGFQPTKIDFLPSTHTSASSSPTIIVSGGSSSRRGPGR